MTRSLIFCSRIEAFAQAAIGLIEDVVPNRELARRARHLPGGRLRVRLLGARVGDDPDATLALLRPAGSRT